MVLMGITEIQQFITIPNLPDVVVFIISLALLIGQCLIKAFVKKDNRNVIFQVSSKTKDLDDAIREFKKEKRQLEKERNQFRKEMDTLKNAIKQSSSNTPELVSNGTANEISKMLDKSMNIVEEEEDVER